MREIEQSLEQMAPEPVAVSDVACWAYGTREPTRSQLKVVYRAVRKMDGLLVEDGEIRRRSEARSEPS
jgi:hypothetical protein